MSLPLTAPKTKTTVDNCNRADKLKMGKGETVRVREKKKRRIVILEALSLRLSTTKSPAHWFDKFPSGGNELNRDKTKDHPVEK